MSIFHKINSFRERRYIKSTFGNFVSEETADKLLSGVYDVDLTIMKYFDVEFILIKVDDTNFDSLPYRIRDLTDYLLNQENVIIDNLFSSIIYAPIVNKDLSDQVPLIDRRIYLVDNILRHFGKTIKVIHGRKKCLIGNLGNDKYMQYNYALPDLTSIMKELINMSYGEEKEI